MDIHEWPRCIQSIRRKKRLVKTDRDKQLIQLSKMRDELREQKRLLPKVPLKHPYQRGWKRFFVLREDIKRGPKADFYEALLAKINTVRYHHDKSFKCKKRRKGRNLYTIKQQLLDEFSDFSWQANRMKLTEEEQSCFTRVEFINTSRRLDVKYVMTEPWRYVLKIVPHFITHVKLIDVDIERKLSYINHFIDNNHLHPQINRLTRGRRYRWKDEFNERLKYINELKNIPRYATKETYLELEK